MLAEILTYRLNITLNSYVHFPDRRLKLLEIENKVSELLTLSDLLPVRVSLATYAANYLNQVPLWMMIIAEPSSGKTEILGSMYDLPHSRVISDLTKSSLVSGTSKKETSKEAKGGLLFEFGDFGFMIIKDMTTLLSKHPDAAAELFGSLREVYDGDFIRYFGNDGGTHKEWHGRLGVIVAVTPAIEKHRSGISSMGDRFLSIRMYNCEDLRMIQAQTAMKTSGQEQQIRAEMQELTKQLFQDFKPNTDQHLEFLSGVHYYIAPLAALVASCRTPVERSGYYRDIEFIHTTEGYARLSKQLYGLLNGCIAIGCSISESWRIVVRVALDTIPEQRSQILEAVILNEEVTGRESFTLSKLKTVTRLPKRTNERIVSDLYAVNVIDCHFADGNRPFDYWLSPRIRSYIDSFTLFKEEDLCIPENRDDHIPTNSNVEYREHKPVESDDTNVEEINNVA